ncbi:helix-turn-helix domain-containing protein [Bradyrhizobium sp. LB11.1]|uniref:AraC-like ligand-binding domain-containing protein n=1 Tax=Bradyrhizobium sp. LB11.1 TaxID=3156326 RepID=UPI003391B162
MKSASWSTGDVQPAERFAYWREAVCQTYLPLEPEELSSGYFDGDLKSISGASLQLSRVRTIASVVRRTRSGIGSFQDGSFFANLQIAGEAVVEQHGTQTLAHAGDIVLVDTNEPFTIRFEQGCNIICANIPGDRLRRHLRQVSRRPASVISGCGAGRLASAYLGALAEIPEDFDFVDDLAADQLCALLVRATSVGTVVTPPHSRQQHLLQRILTLIADELYNPRLSAKYACHHLKISRSRLFAVLTEAGLTFATRVRETRLNHSLEQLSDPRFSELAIGEISRRCGFANQETFNRAFRKRFRATPGACRAGTAAR